MNSDLTGNLSLSFLCVTHFLSRKSRDKKATPLTTECILHLFQSAAASTSLAKYLATTLHVPAPGDMNFRIYIAAEVRSLMVIIVFKVSDDLQ